VSAEKADNRLHSMVLVSSNEDVSLLQVVFEPCTGGLSPQILVVSLLSTSNRLLAVSMMVVANGRYSTPSTSLDAALSIVKDPFANAC
jgi:hypothetical protein